MGEKSLVLASKSIIKLINIGIFKCCNFLVINPGLTVSQINEVKESCFDLVFLKVMIGVPQPCPQDCLFISVNSQIIY